MKRVFTECISREEDIRTDRQKNRLDDLFRQWTENGAQKVLKSNKK